MTRTELVAKIDLTRTAMMHAGPIHHRDLKKHLRRMEAELKEYDRFQKEAKEQK